MRFYQLVRTVAYAIASALSATMLVLSTPAGRRFPADAGNSVAALVSTAVLVAALLDELARGRPRVVGVDLVADQQHQVGPPLVRRSAQVQGVGDHRVRAVFLLVLPRAAGAEPTRQDGQFGGPAGSESQPERPARVRRPEHARRELRVRLGPADDAV